ncbi:MAG TPA: exonuclease domain-containing protein [Vitreimonas sp.]|uniref:exonuclease domain-containing protein n=1 Tax=Vitreimonas sp. TaxID=3069702 RepID=UPI002D5EB8E1|nr:exonuclease domain-containing protein [Vitreimonas sp.]HYD86254.1 exonuclease domain-containing protein [Vitreimonas sp.]
MTFVFYDTETTGTSRHYDQILQFAAICTDDDLNEIERFELRCRLLPHVIPTAGAILLTGVSLDRLLDPTLPSHHDFICQCHAKLTEWSPATFIGYNSVRFDEPLLRQAFYQNLKPIYLTNTDGNARQDVLPLMRAANCLSPGTFRMPTNDEGKVSFKLDRVAPLNGFPDHDAHDALGDVLATIHLARLLKERAPDVWRRSLTFCNRTGVESFIDENECFYLIDTVRNDGAGYFSVPIGRPKHKDRQVICLNLNVDLAEIEAMDANELGKWLRKSPRPVRRFRTNAAPHLLHLDEVPEHLFGEMTARKARLRAHRYMDNSKLQRRIAKVLEDDEREYEAGTTVEEQIYDGFYSNTDKRLLDQFHAAPWSERWGISKQFEDKRLKSLARRLIYFEQPDALPPSQQAQVVRKMAARMLGHEKDGDWTCIPTATKELRERWREADEAQRALLKPLRAYLQNRKKWAKSMLGS